MGLTITPEIGLRFVARTGIFNSMFINPFVSVPIGFGNISTDIPSGSDFDGRRLFTIRGGIGIGWF